MVVRCNFQKKKKKKILLCKYMTKIVAHILIMHTPLPTWDKTTKRSPFPSTLNILLPTSKDPPSQKFK